MSNKPTEEARYAAAAARMEAGDFGPIPPAPTAAEQAHLDELLAEFDALEPVTSDEPTPAMPPTAEIVTRADVDELAELARGIGRPSIGSTRPRGTSPKRQVRLPIDLDEALTRRAEAEHRSASDVMRMALEKYLQAS